MAALPRRAVAAGPATAVPVPCEQAPPPTRGTDPMTDHSKIKAQLEQRLEELISRAEHIEDDLGHRHVRDWDDSAIESEGDEVLDEVGQAAVKEIERVRASLAAIEDGTYGVCSECGATISAERLEALPEATRCRRCA